jgi:hypothetical protein
VIYKVPPNDRKEFMRKVWDLAQKMDVAQHIGKISIFWGRRPQPGPFPNRCGDCNQKNSAMVILQDKVWLGIAKKDERLCYECIERRLRRKILWSDLKPCGITHEMFIGVQIAMNTVAAQHRQQIKEAFNAPRR